jgi:plastocyanin
MDDSTRPSASTAWRRRWLTGIGLALGVLAAAGPAHGVGHTVQARNYEFAAPGGGSTLTVTAGDQVTWVASGDPHTVTSGAPGAVTDRFVDHPGSVGFLVAGDTFTTTFTTPGTYPYFCEVHPEQMTGVIAVVAASTPPPTAVPSKAPTPRPTTPSTAAPATATPAPSPLPVASASPAPSPTAVETPSPSALAERSPVPTGDAAQLLTASAGASTEPGAPASETGTPAALPVALVAIMGAVVVGGILIARRRDRGQHA